MKRYVKATVKPVISEAESLRADLARDETTRPEVLRQLAEDSETYIRYCVAANPNSPLDLLYKLNEDDSWGVKVGIAENPNTPVDLLSDLASHSSWHVREAVAGNENTPRDQLRHLCNDINADVQRVADYAWLSLTGHFFGDASEDYDG